MRIRGKLSQRCQVHGLECHSGLPDQGVNAVEYAAHAVVFLNKMAKRVRENGPFDDGYDPPYTTIHTGVIKGGTALNIVPRECWFDFEFRYLPGDDPVKYLQEFQQYVNSSLLPEMQAVSSETDIELHTLSKFPGLSNEGERRGGLSWRSIIWVRKGLARLVLAQKADYLSRPAFPL